MPIAPQANSSPEMRCHRLTAQRTLAPSARHRPVSSMTAGTFGRDRTQIAPLWLRNLNHGWMLY